MPKRKNPKSTTITPATGKVPDEFQNAWGETPAPRHKPHVPLLTSEKRQAAVAGLRREAMERLAWNSESINNTKDLIDNRNILTELEIKQIELELQQERLQKALQAVQSSNQRFATLYDKYVDLFDFAPIAYLVINRQGLICESNLKAAALLDLPRSELTGRPFTDFIHKKDQDQFYLLKTGCLQNHCPARCDITLTKTGGTAFTAHLSFRVFSTGHFQDEDIRLTFSDISDQLQVTKNLSLSHNCLKIANDAASMETLLEGFAAEIKSFLECDAVGIRLADEQGGLPYKARLGFNRSFYQSGCALEVAAENGMCRDILNGFTPAGQPFFTPGGSFYTNAADRLLAGIRPEQMAATCSVCSFFGYSSVAVIPIRIDRRVIGLIHAADAQSERFPLPLVQELEWVALRLAVAVQRLAIQEKLDITISDLRRLSTHLLTVQEEEQARIAMELHDQTGQDLGLLKLRLAKLYKGLGKQDAPTEKVFGQTDAFIDQIIENVRRLSHGLRPPLLDQIGLAGAVGALVNDYQALTGITFDIDVNSLDMLTDPTAQVLVFRIVQEALSNIHKHSGGRAGRPQRQAPGRPAESRHRGRRPRIRQRQGGQTSLEKTRHGAVHPETEGQDDQRRSAPEKQAGSGNRHYPRHPHPNGAPCSMKPYTIVLADDHVMMREAIRDTIEGTTGLAVAGEAGDGLELLRLLKKTPADLVVLDISMPGMRGIEAAREIRTSHPHMKILFLSMHKNRELLTAAIAAGADGYLLKEDTSKELLAAIEAVRKDRTYLSAKLVAQYPSDIINIFRGNNNDKPEPLTHRERQVLKLIAEGKTDRQIGELLFISLRTVQRHRFNIRTKLNIKRTADLVKYAMERGYT